MAGALPISKIMRGSAGGCHSIECQWDFEGLRGIRQPGRLARRATLALRHPVERVNGECNDQQHSDGDEKRGVPTVTCLDDDTGAALLPVDHVAPCAASPSAAVLAAARVETIQVQRQIKSLGETWFQGGWVEPMERIAAPQGVLLRQQHSVAEPACGMARLGPRGTTHRTACSIPMEINTIVGLAAAFCTTDLVFSSAQEMLGDRLGW